MTICVISHRDGYNLREGSFRHGWDGRLKEIRSIENMRETICTNCRIRSLCSMCAANGELESGDAETPVDFLCQVAHLRAFSLGVEVPKHGDCACCTGGSHHAALLESSERIKKDSASSKNLVFMPSPGSVSQLPVVNNRGGCSPGGCSSCGTRP
jgi:hypothetical protein